MIGCGETKHLLEFRKATGFRGTLLTDPTRELFSYLGFAQGFSGLLAWRPIKDAFAAFRAGFRPGSLQGNALQLGGALVLGTDGTILYRYQSSDAGDHPPIEDLLGAAPKDPDPGGQLP